MCGRDEFSSGDALELRAYTCPRSLPARWMGGGCAPVLSCPGGSVCVLPPVHVRPDDPVSGGYRISQGASPEKPNWRGVRGTCGSCPIPSEVSGARVDVPHLLSHLQNGGTTRGVPIARVGRTGVVYGMGPHAHGCTARRGCRNYGFNLWVGARGAHWGLVLSFALQRISAELTDACVWGTL